MGTDETERNLRKILEASPNDADVIGTLARFMHHVGKDHDEAERLYRRAVAILPNDARMVCMLAWFLYSAREDYGEAESLYRRALQLDPQNARINAGLACVLEGARNYDDAEYFYQTAIDLDPNSAMNNYRFAVFLQHVRRNYSSAESFYRRAVQLCPNDEYFNYELANYLYNVQQDLEEAEHFYRAALDLDPSDPNTIDDYASALLENGHTTKAAAIVDRCWALNKGTNSQAGAIALLYQALIRRLSQGDDQSSLGTLKSLLAAGFTRYSGTLVSHIAAISVELPREDQAMYHSLATAILDEQKVRDLETSDRWSQIVSVPLNP